MPWAAIGEFFRAIAVGLGLISDRSKLKNDPKVQAAKQAQDDQKEIDKINKAIADENVKEIRKDSADSNRR